MKRASIFLIAVLSAQLVWAQSPKEKARIDYEAKEKGYWVDGDTKLMWTVKDNGSDIDWNQADAYCRGMTLGGLTGWRLASIDELQRMFDASLPGLPSTYQGKTNTYKIRGPIQLSNGWVWSGTKDGSSEAWYFNFNNGERISYPLANSPYERALCVRVSEPGKVSRAKGTEESKRQSPQAKEKGYWVDGDTKLMWTVKDNGNDIDWNKAVAYCRGMTLGGLTGWRLASIEELQRMFDPSIASEYKIKSPLQLSSWGVWSGTKDGSSEAWIFYFGLGKRGSLHLDASYYTRALCVRVSKK